MKPTLFYLVGLPASGKSVEANLISQQYNANIHSSDKIREELFTDENNQDNNELVFKTMLERTKSDLLKNNNVIYDATNINYKRRKAFVESLNKIDCYKICILMATPYDDCIKYNQERERQVPKYVIDKMYKNFYIPQKYEGWDEIQTVWNYNQTNFEIENLFNGENGLNKINQDNPHHSSTIGVHCSRCAGEIFSMSLNEIYNPELFEAALLHDIGKRFTKEFKDSKSEPSDIAHYYQHHLVSAYDSLFYTDIFDDISRLKVANYIQWHMQPFVMESDKQKEKYRKLWGDQFYEEIMLLHEADERAR